MSYILSNFDADKVTKLKLWENVTKYSPHHIVMESGNTVYSLRVLFYVSICFSSQIIFNLSFMDY